MPKKVGKSPLSSTNKSPPGGRAGGKNAKQQQSSAGGKGSGGGAAENDLPPPAGYLISCDIPTKQYIQYLNVLKEPADKKFIVQDLDATHLLVKQKAKSEILEKVEDWENSNVYSAVEKVGEDFDLA
mmetsp:Transcript_8459/g.11136  ORF Transcript_8459/g.11136 Transcript_8459/m.11136 type:complete len:127 (-) Transcript_8459:68-448(-)|eukprot:CAMPEP_0198143006 /NCGR_PEP_ID=MMETSP1443-20131203/5647_1 /TAXON_ID=186043 /ORGANISM="Entomoneis sp., Strain CCMP2396" /LENGTH=126 /DNA_ID=CAMNT_0043806143 /DNA_START=203 /DNA_END=583 /DNA_ORIENTATION=-